MVDKQPRVIVLRGLPASGKSTYAKRLVADDPMTVRWNNDQFREMAYNRRFVPKREEFVVAMRDAFIEEALSRNLSVVVDNTNLNPVHLITMRKKFSIYEGVEVVDFPIKVLDAIRRDKGREFSVGPNVIQSMYADFVQGTELDLDSE